MQRWKAGGTFLDFIKKTSDNIELFRGGGHEAYRNCLSFRIMIQKSVDSCYFSASVSII